MTANCSESREVTDDISKIKRIEEELEVEFDRQVDTLISSGVHKHVVTMRMGEQGFRDMLNQLKDPLRDVRFTPEYESPQFLIVIPSGLVSLQDQCHRISWDGRYVVTALLEKEMSVISNGRPHCLPYLAVQIDMGCDYRPLSLEEYSSYICGTGQSPFYVEEIISLMRCKPPAMLQDKFFCANMRHRPDSRGVYLQLGKDNFELNTEDKDIVGQNHRYPSCMKRLYITRKPIRLDGPASYD